MEWSTQRLKHLCVRYADYGANVPSDAYVPDGGLRFLRTTDISASGDLSPRDTGVFVHSNDALDAVLCDGDLLLSRSGTIGRSLLYSAERHGPCSFAGYLVRFRPSPAVEGRFLFYWTKSVGFMDQILRDSIQTTIQNFNGQKFAAMDLAIPIHKEVQQFIADFLDRKTAAIDALIEKKERLIILLEEKRQALITQAVTKGLDPNVPMKDSGVEWIGQVPVHWQIAPLRAVLRHRGEYNTRLQTTNILSVVKDVGVIPYSERKASGNKHSEDISKYKVIHSGDLVMNRMNIIIGSVGVSRHHGASSIEYYVLRSASRDVSTEFFGDVFTCRGFQNSLVGLGSGILSHRMRISTDAMSRLLLPRPPREEQDQVHGWIRAQTQKDATLGAKLRHAVELLHEYRQALITAAVTGKVDVSVGAAE